MKGDYILEIMFHSYDNPEDRRMGGNRCDGGSARACESYLHYCLGGNSCPGATYFNYDIYTSAAPSPNPVSLSISGSWPVSHCRVPLVWCDPLLLSHREASNSM